MVDFIVWFQLTALLLLLLLAVAVDMRRESKIPLVARPGPLVVVAILVGSLATSGFTDSDHWEYFKLWIAQVGGALVGILFWPYWQKRGEGRASIYVLADRAEKMARSIFAAACISAILFFAWKGVPFLQANVEQGRVDAAAEGTGYIRLLAYLSVPACLIIVALSTNRGNWRYVLVAVFIILGMANRSPLLYLFAPLLFVYLAKNGIQISNLKVIGVGATLLAVVVSLGTYRIVSQEEFLNYDEFAQDLASGNIAGVALTSLTHYAKVVAENAVLTKDLVDSGLIDYKYGFSYFILFYTAMPGEQLSLDREIKLLSGKTFVGGGTPPTLMGEGYVNFGYIGTALAGFMVVTLLNYWFSVIRNCEKAATLQAESLAAAIYGYMVCWVVSSQVGGLVGASTVPMAGALVLVCVWMIAKDKAGAR